MAEAEIGPKVERSALAEVKGLAEVLFEKVEDVAADKEEEHAEREYMPIVEKEKCDVKEVVVAEQNITKEHAIKQGWPTFCS